MAAHAGGGRGERRKRDWEKDKVRKKPTQYTQPNGPESLPHLQNQKHLLIASKRQRGSAISERFKLCGGSEREYLSYVNKLRLPISFTRLLQLSSERDSDLYNAGVVLIII